MKIKLYQIFILLILSLLSACNGCSKQKKTEENTGNTSNTIGESTLFAIDIPITIFDDNWNQFYDDREMLTLAQYNDLKLESLSFMDGYDQLQYQIGQVLVEKEDRALLTVKAISSGEISEYLLAYVNSNITDSLLVAYEDNVEYFSKTLSIVKHDTISVMNIIWEDNDTITSRYIITPEMTFDEIIE